MLELLLLLLLNEYY